MRRLGSRLYYEFTEAALSSEAEWERLTDSVAVEVRRHGAPAPSSASPTTEAGAGKAVTQASGGKPAAPSAKAAVVPAPAKTVAGAAPVLAPVREVATPSVGVSSVVHTTVNNNNINSNNSTNSTNNSNNSCDTILVLM